MAYPPVNIHNSTQYVAWGGVEYSSIFCSNDSYYVTPNTNWQNDRGVCLIEKITATLRTPKGDIVAKPYESSGTSYSQFAIIETGPYTFEVTRRVSAFEDSRPANYVEPVQAAK